MSEQDKKQTPECDACGCSRGKLHCTNWLADIPGGYADSDMVEVQFKNTRKGFYKNSLDLDLNIGDLVVVEASPGYDIGRVSLTGALVNLQMRKANIKPGVEVRRVYRKAKPMDEDKFRESCAKETDTMIRARKIAEDLGLRMKIGDVEYQGDGTKAIFYYIADERVDFRQLIKVLAEAFHIRIEMKQIGARQEAGRIGGIGPCGRPLCCSSWMTNFMTVATSAARFQDISLNPQKLAGQCAKLKCCLNFEVDAYVESAKRMPPKDVRLETADGTYFHFKSDIFKREITYSTDKSQGVNLVAISADRAFEIIALNKQGEKPLSLLPDGQQDNKDRRGAHDILDQDGLTRFDDKRKKKKSKNKKGNAKKQDKPVGNQSDTPQAEDQSESDGKQGDGQGEQQKKPSRHKKRNKGKGQGQDGPSNVAAMDTQQPKDE